jgi:thioredoxin reductase (NADPH)
MHQAIVIGAGPAGIAAAIQLKRFGLNVAVIEKNSIGGLIKNANLIENYLAFPNGITGHKFAKLLSKQLSQYDIPVFFEEVVEIIKKDTFTVKTLKNTYNSRFIVVATGTKPVFTDLQIPEQAKNKIFYEIKDIHDTKNTTVAIIGAGDASFDYALNLCKYNKINIFNRSEVIKALPLLHERIKKQENISLYSNHELESIKNSDKELILRFKNNEKVFLADYLLFATGRQPEDSLLTKELKENSDLFMIGDVKNGILRQTAVAAGDGLKAAAEIYGIISAK